MSNRDETDSPEVLAKLIEARIEYKNSDRCRTTVSFVHKRELPLVLKALRLLAKEEEGA